MIVVLNVPGRVVGVVVDSVSDTIEPSAGETKAAPQADDSLGAKHIVGIASVKLMVDADHRMLIPLDIAALLSEAAIGRVVAS